MFRNLLSPVRFLYASSRCIRLAAFEAVVTERLEQDRGQWFRQSVRKLVFCRNSREFDGFVAAVFMEESKAYFEVLRSFGSAETVAHLNACVVVLPNCHWFAAFTNAAFFAQ